MLVERLALGLGILASAGAVRTNTADTPFKLTVETREPVRFYLADSAGRQQMPAGTIAYDKGAEHHFIATRPFEIQLPAGRYELRAERGPEYRPWTTSVIARAGESKSVTASVVHWIDMKRRGWYSADLHNHRRVEEMPQLLLAEDLNLAPTLADWIWEDAPVSQPPRTSEAIRQVDATHVYSVLDKEVERLVQGPGAVDLLGLRATIPFEGYRLYPPNDAFCRRAHAQGGYVDAEKILWRDTAALVALNQIDFAGIVHNHFQRGGVELETDEWGMIPKQRPEFQTVAGMPLWAMEVYYRFLNCGFRLPVSAGSASGVKPSPLGYNRVYVKLDEPFSYAGWFRALKAGRSFGTNGPMLFLTVNGREPGATVPAGPRLSIHAEAASTGRLDRLEIVLRGKVIKSASARNSSGKLAVDFEQDVEEAGWVAARCFEQADATIRFAHTSPVYIDAPRRPPAAEDAKFFLDWIDREIAFYEKQAGFRSPNDREAMLEFFGKARAVYSAIAARGRRE